MKKRALMLALLLTVCVAAAGCTDKTTKDNDTDKKTEDVSKTEEPEDDDTEDTDKDAEEETEKTTAEILAELDLDKYVTLGEYKGLAVEKVIPSVTDEAVEKAIQEALAKYPVEVEGRSAEEGDTLNIDYVGRIDGEEFSGGKDTGTDLKLGSQRFIPGFEDGLIGAKKGETRVLDLTFPDDYNKELSGKAVEFTVTVNMIKAPLEEPTDEWVAANIEGYYSLEEFENSIRSEQEETNIRSAEEQLRYNAWQQAVDNATINEYPKALVELGKELYNRQVELIAKFAGMELEEYIESSDISREEYDADAEEYGKDIAAQALVSQAICKAEGFAIGDEDYKAKLAEMLTNGYTEEELMEKYGRDNVEQSIMLNRVTSLILEHAVVTEVEATPEAEDEE